MNRAGAAVYKASKYCLWCLHFKLTPIHMYGASGNVTGPHLHLGVYTGEINNDQYGYYKVNDELTYFNDYGLGYIDYNNYRFFDPAQVIATNGGVIC